MQTATRQPPPSRVAAVLAYGFGKFDPAFTAKWEAHRALPRDEVVKVFWQVLMKYAPTCMLCLIPFVALYLKLLNIGLGWRYGEHLVFAIHLQAFILLMMLNWFCLSPWRTIANLTLIWLFLYPALALRRMYGGTWPVLLVSWPILVALEWVSIQIVVQFAFFLTLTH